MLDRTKLDNETWINQEDDAVSQLLNEGHHINNCINVAFYQDCEVVGNSLPDNMKDVINKVMD